MQLQEIFSSLKTLEANSTGKTTVTLAREGLGDTGRDSANSSKHGIAKEKFRLLQEYFKTVGQTKNPFINQMMDFISCSLPIEPSSTSTQAIPIPSEQESMVLNFLDELIAIPLKHQRELDKKRKQLSINYQEGIQPPPNVQNDADASLGTSETLKHHLQLPDKVTRATPKPIVPLNIPNQRDLGDLKSEIEIKIPLNHERNPNGIQAKKQDEAYINPQDSLSRSKFGKKTETDYLADYGVKWDLTKCIRDMFQNFHDAHGLTLEGVVIRIVKNQDQSYTVRIEGEGEYHPEYIEKTGATTKKDSDSTAGGYGEGAKILSLVFLRDHNIEGVRFSSRNWTMDYSLDQFASGRQGLFRELNITSDRPGNYLELKTKSSKVVEAICKGVNLFYHPANPDFHNPTFENHVGGFKVLQTSQGGNIYPMKQRYQIGYESNPKWDGGLVRLSFWTTQKDESLKTDRDRSALDSTFIYHQIIKPFVHSMTDEELLQGIKLLEDLWEGSDHKTSHGGSVNSDAVALLQAIVNETEDRGMSIKFPDKYVAKINNLPDGILEQLKIKGYIFCMHNFHSIGMQSSDDLIQEKNRKEGLEPSESEIKQINIMKDAALTLIANFMGKTSTIIRVSDTKKPIYIFDRHKSEFHQNHSACYGDDHLWFDRSYLATSSFEDALATYLHELTHKHGGDETAEFSYKITDWIDICMKALNDPDTVKELNDLKSLWNEIVPESKKKKTVSGINFTPE